MDDALKNEEIEIIDKTDCEEASTDDATGIDQENLVIATKQVSARLQQEKSPHTVLGNVVILSDDKKVHEQAHLRGIRTIRSDDVRLGLPTTHSPSPSPPSSSSGSDDDGDHVDQVGAKNMVQPPPSPSSALTPDSG